MIASTFNVNSVRSRLPILEGWLQTRRPDIVCLQETKVVDEAFPVEALRAWGYNVVFRGEKAYNGVAIMSRRPADAVVRGFDDGGPPDETRLLAARIDGLWVVNTYVPQGRAIDHAMYAYKLEWFDRLRGFFDRHFTLTDRLLWTGDLNVAREPMDVHDPAAHTGHVCYHEAVRKAFNRCIDWGFVDVFRRFHPEDIRYSFFDYRTPNGVQRNIGWRLDYLLATPPLADKASSCAIDVDPRLQPKPSDHTPVWAAFDE